MKPIKQLTASEYESIKVQAIELLEQLQNHHIAAVMEGSKDKQDIADEYIYRSMRVGLSNGNNVPNLYYQISKLDLAIETLE